MSNMKKNKNIGFTLIELLAVIVILAILALIVSPIISGVIKDSKIAVAARSMDGYVEAIESASLRYYTLNGRLANVSELTIEAKNIDSITNSNVTLTSTGTVAQATAKIDKYNCSYKEGKGSTCYESNVVPELTFDDSKCSTTLTSISDIDTMNGKLNTCVNSPIGEVTYTGSIGKTKGDYVINYSVEDEFGNIDTLSKTFTVNITLTIEFDDTKCNTTLTTRDAVTAMNNKLDTCVNASGTITHTGTIESANGTYNIVYTVTDTYGNTNTLQKTFTVELPASPSITYEDFGDEIYYDPVNDIVGCTTYTESNSASGIVEGCLKWHVLSENADGSVNLILDHNIVSEVKWYSSNNNSQGPTVAKEALNNAIKDKWSANLVRSDSYSHGSYTVSYNGMKARLPEAQEIANAVGHDTWNEDTATNSNYFYFDSKSTSQTVGYGKDKTTSDYAWLFNNLGSGTSTDASSSSTCLYYGCTMAQAKSSGDYGYWTSTALAGPSSQAWHVYFIGDLGSGHVTYTRGVRPVITLNSN